MLPRSSHQDRLVGQGAEGGREALFEHESDYDRESPVETGFSLLLQVDVEVKVLVTYTLTSFPVLAAAAVQHHLPRSPPRLHLT